MSQPRKSLDWEKQINLSIAPPRARKARDQRGTTSAGCSMCGKYCAMELVARYLGTSPVRC